MRVATETIASTVRGIIYIVQNLIFTRNFVYSTLTILFLVFNVHGIANAQGTLTLSPNAITGHPGDEHRITVTARDGNGDPVSGVLVEFVMQEPSGWFRPRSGRTDSAGVVTSVLVLPIRSATFYVRATGYSIAGMLVKVVSVPNSIVKVSGDNQYGETDMPLDSPFVVRVGDIKGYALPGKLVTFSILSGGGQLSATMVRTDSRGEAQTRLTLGEAPGGNAVEVIVRDVPPVQFSAIGVGVPEALRVASGSDQSGFLNRPLAAPIAVQVKDKKGYAVAGVRVTFRVTEGRGTLSPSWIRTDRGGFAATTVTPGSPGTLSIEARADDLLPVTFTLQVGNPPDKVLRISGNDQSRVPGSRLAAPFVVEVQDENAQPIAGVTVTFTVIAGRGRLSAATATTAANGQAQTYLTLGSLYGLNTVKASVARVFRGVRFNATSGVQVLTPTATHPPIYWIDASAGTFYRLTGTKVERLVSGVQNVTSFAVDVEAGKLYWTEQTGDRTGNIQRADLDGKNVQLIKELRSVPRSITIDTARNKLYLTNSWGKIQRLNLDGTQFEPNFITGLDSPMDIFLDVTEGKVYWTEGTGHIRAADLNKNPNIRNVAVGSGKLLDIAVAAGKVYWVEQVGQDVGKIRCIGTNGKNAEDLATLRTAPRGIAVDTAGRKLYWTNARGRLQYADINGKRIRNIAKGLIRPGDLAVDTTTVGVMEIVAETTHSAPAASARPSETVLLTNYPNPFNPETWIPYHLANTTDVRINIYDAQGTLVRMLTLGHQSAGYYTSRRRAAYWDGRNALGERVASGIYFYQLQTDKISPMRKMVILK